MGNTNGKGLIHHSLQYLQNEAVRDYIVSLYWKYIGTGKTKAW